MKKISLTICALFALNLLVLGSPEAQAKLNVVTTIQDLASIAREVGGDNANVDAIAKGTQDPHFIEAKPSFMTKTSRADLVISIGLDLEIGWLPNVVLGARNPKVAPGSSGFLEVGSMVQPLELPTGKITRAEGDVHPLGNPHVTLDPIRAGEIAIVIAQRMGQLDSENATTYMTRAKAMQKRLQDKTKVWQARVNKSGVKKAISYHKTLTYFFDRFNIDNPAILEPKPGIPPTAGHTLDVISLIKEQKIPLIMVENYFDPTVTNRIKESVPSIRVTVVPVAVDGAPGINSVDDLIENLIKTVEGK